MNVVPDLGGLLSTEAEQLYRRLLRDGVVPVVGEPGAQELIDVGAAYVTGKARLSPVSPPVALRLMLERQHRELAARHRALAEGWRHFSNLVELETSPGREASGVGSSGVGIEALPGPDEAARRAVELRLSAQREVRVTATSALSPVPGAPAGVRVRTIYDASYAAWGSSLRPGEQARIRTAVPTNLVHVDDRAAIVGALLITNPGLVATLAGWFDLMWLDVASVGVSHERTDLTPAQHRVLRLLATGRSDLAISRECGTSVRTVHRHVRAVLDVLGVESRFAAGAAAARRGWI